MDKLAKVMKGLEACIKGDCRENACPYALENECRKSLERDALELLKAQEPKKLRCIRCLTKAMKGICPVCEMEIESVIHGRITKFCKYCGQAVKWE